MKKRYAVQVAMSIANRPQALELMLLEWLRYAGIVSIVREEHKEDSTWVVFQLRAPVGCDAQEWAKQNAARIRSFAYNAEVVNW